MCQISVISNFKLYLEIGRTSVRPNLKHRILQKKQWMSFMLNILISCYMVWKYISYNGQIRMYRYRYTLHLTHLRFKIHSQYIQQDMLLFSSMFTSLFDCDVSATETVEIRVIYTLDVRILTQNYLLHHYVCHSFSSINRRPFDQSSA